VTVGFDPTTQHVLALPLPEGGAYTRMTALEGSNLELCRDAFSNHDFQSLHTVWILPLTTKGQHVGVALIAESEMDRLETRARSVLFSSVARLVATKITQPHVAAVEDLPRRAVVLSHEGLVEEAERLARSGANRVIVAEIDVPVLVSAVAESHESMDRLRLSGEITRFVATMLSAVAHIGTTRDGRTVALMGSGANPKLLLHQVARGLRKLFPELTETPDLLRGSVVWDTATSDFEDVLEAVSPPATRSAEA
jgi:hypothetical protein